MRKKYFVFFVFFLILLDQVLKIWVFKNHLSFSEPGWWWEVVPGFEIRYLENSGVAFGWLKNSGFVTKFLLSFFRLLVVVFMFYFVFFKFKKLSFLSFFVFGLLVAGASGNCIDSVFYEVFNLNNSNLGGGFFSGNVIDMLHFNFVWPDWAPFGLGKTLVFPPVFNLADSYISIGCVFGLIFYKKLSVVSV